MAANKKQVCNSTNKKRPDRGVSIHSIRGRSLPPGCIDCDKDKNYADSCGIETARGFKTDAI